MRVHGPTPEGSTVDGDGPIIQTHTATLRYVVEGVTGDTRARWSRAENAPGIPAYGDLFPGYESEFVRVLRKTVRTLGDGRTFEVLVQYEQPPYPEDDGTGEEDETPARITISGSTVEVETNLDKDGKAISVSYTPPTGATIVQPGTVRVRKRVIRYVFTRQERRAPIDLVETHANTVNGDYVGRFQPGSLYLEAINAWSDDAQQSFEVEYVVLRQRAGSWDPSLFFVDPRTNRPPPDLVEGVGIKTIPSYDTSAFAKLRLQWPK